MAKQRQTNVNINYTVTSTDLQRGNALLAQASKATDDLRRKSDTYAKTASAQNKNVSTSIAGMTMQMQRLRTQIEYTNKADTKRLTELSGQYKALKTQVDAYNRALFQTNTATKQNATSAGQMASQFGQVYNTIRLIIAAGMARELVNTAISAAALTGNIEGVERAFNRAFPNGRLLIDELRKATHGAVNDFELMQRTLQATNLGVSASKLGVLFEFAAARAQQTGESVDYLVDSIVNGIGKKSTQVLDNLGISATRLKEQFDGASIASRSVAEVTEGVAEIAQVELQKMGGYIETSKTQVDQLSVSWAKLKAEISETITGGGSGGFIGVMKSYIDSFTALFRAMNEGKQVAEVFAEIQREQIAITSVNEFVNRTFTKSKEDNIEVVKEEIQALTEDLGVYTRFRDQMEKTIATQKEELRVVESRLKTGLDGQKIRTAEAIELQRSIELHERMLSSKRNDALIDQEIIRLLQSKLAELKKVNKEMGVEAGESESEGRRRRPPRQMTQVVDLRYRNPDTGVISKESNDKILRDFIEDGIKLVGTLPPAEIPIVPIILMSDWEKALESHKSEIIDASSSIIQEQVDSILFAEVESYNQRIDALRGFYDEQVALAGDNERAKMELRIKEEREIEKLERERADREKKAVLASIRTNTALSVMKVFAGDGTWADKLIRAAIVTAIGTSQYVAANRERYYAKGVIDLQGPGTKTSDSIPAMLSKGESVMTADETVSSRGIFKAIRAKKLNDQVLRDIVSGKSGGALMSAFDDSRLLKKLDEVKSAQTDIVERHHQLYKLQENKDSFKRYMRINTIGR